MFKYTKRLISEKSKSGQKKMQSLNASKTKHLPNCVTQWQALGIIKR